MWLYVEYTASEPHILCTEVMLDGFFYQRNYLCTDSLFSH